MDITDFLAHDRRKEFLVGYYKNSESAPEAYFEYGIENDKTTAYNMLIKNVMSARSNMIIHTTWDMGWDTLGFVELQDGTDWQVVDYTTRLTKHNPNVLRIIKSNPATEYVLSLVAVDNPLKKFRNEYQLYRTGVTVKVNEYHIPEKYILQNGDKIEVFGYVQKFNVNDTEYDNGADIIIKNQNISISGTGSAVNYISMKILFRQTD